jgi:hypothetical protein
MTTSCLDAVMRGSGSILLGWRSVRAGDIPAPSTVIGAYRRWPQRQRLVMDASNLVAVRGGLLILRGWARVVSRSTLHHTTVQIAARQPPPMQLGVGQFEELLV